jgi:hypothetical protein
MKKFLIGLLTLGSLSSFANQVNVTNQTLPEKINLKVKADKIVTSDMLSTITYFNIRLESDEVIVEGAKKARFLNNAKTYNGLCNYLGHQSTVNATSTSSGFSRDVELLYSNVSADNSFLTIEVLYSANYLIDISCQK